MTDLSVAPRPTPYRSSVSPDTIRLQRAAECRCLNNLRAHPVGRDFAFICASVPGARVDPTGPPPPPRRLSAKLNNCCSATSPIRSLFATSGTRSISRAPIPGKLPLLGLHERRHHEPPRRQLIRHHVFASDDGRSFSEIGDDDRARAGVVNSWDVYWQWRAITRTIMRKTLFTVVYLLSANAVVARGRQP